VDRVSLLHVWCGPCVPPAHLVWIVCPSCTSGVDLWPSCTSGVDRVSLLHILYYCMQRAPYCVLLLHILLRCCFWRACNMHPALGIIQERGFVSDRLDEARVPAE